MIEKKYVTSLLNKVYKEDMKIKNIGDVLRTPFQMLTGLFTGGAETDLPDRDMILLPVTVVYGIN